MRLNLSLLEEVISPPMWRIGRDSLMQGHVQRLARRHADHGDEGGDGFDVILRSSSRDVDHEVSLGIDFSGSVAVLEEWDCTCRLWDGGCPHVVAASLAVRGALERADPSQVKSVGWRDVLGRVKDSDRGAVPQQRSWICYELSLEGAGEKMVVGVQRRKRTVGDKGRRASGAVLGWKPSAVGHFGYRTGDDPAANRDDLIPVLCSVNRHDLRVRTIQSGFVDVFLRLFVDAPAGTLRVDGDDASVAGVEREVTVIVEDTADGGLEVRARLQTHAPGSSGADHVLLPGPVPWFYLRQERCIVRPACRSSAALDLLRSGPLHISSDDVAAFCRDVVPALRAAVPLEERSSRLPPVLIGEPIPRICLGEADEVMTVELQFAYPPPPDLVGLDGEDAREVRVFQANEGARVFSRPGTGGRSVLWQRDAEVEEGWHRRVCEAISGALPAHLPPDEALDFLIDHLPALEADGAEVYGRDALTRMRPSEHPVRPGVHVRSGVDWFGIKVTLQAGSERLSLADVIQTWRAGTRYIRLAGGEMARLPTKWLTRHSGALMDLQELGQPADEPGEWRVEPFLLPILADLVAEDANRDGRWLAFVDRILNFEGIGSHPLPEGLNADLRSYQRHGYDWLCTVRDLGLHGCLADDMGLGKTVQALTVMLADIESGRATSPSLVVAPTSVVQNWADEAARFTPSLRVLVLGGDDRATRQTQLDNLDNYDLVVTSYALLRHDLERLRGWNFQWAVLDEAQAIKNPGSQTARAARELRANHRLTLTGTPLENNLLELWSLFQYLMPGFFGTRARFVRRYRTRVARAGAAADAMEQLRARLRPFVLRRLKSDVDKELPPITEVTLRCRMETPQRRLYERVRNSYRARVMQLVDDVGLERSALGVLEALLRLRQACCHPDLLPFDEAREVKESAKTSLFLRTVLQLIDEGRRVLVFSQWTTMLKLLRGKLEERGIECAYMDGSTRDRPTVIRAFQAKDGPPIFLISLKAGGVGLNLTAADTVIHYDPWWNPAAEQQASDRAHRIGQTLPVLVLRMVVEDTVEDHILRLQEGKRALAKAAIEAEVDGVKTLNRSDLEAIFGPEVGGRGKDETLSTAVRLGGDG